MELDQVEPDLIRSPVNLIDGLFDEDADRLQRAVRPKGSEPAP